MSKTRRGRSRHRPTQTARNTPEALAPQDTPIDIVFEPAAPEVSWIDEEIAKEQMDSSQVQESEQKDADAEPPAVPDAESLLAVDDDQVTEAQQPEVAEPGIGELTSEDVSDSMDADADADDGYGEPPVPVEHDIEITTATIDDVLADRRSEPQTAEAVDAAEGTKPEGTESESESEEPQTEPPREPMRIPTDRPKEDRSKVGGGDVLDDQTALFEADADQMAESDQSHVPEDQLPVDPEPHEEDQLTDDQPEVERDDKEKKPNPLFKIPLIGAVAGLVADYVHKAKEFKRTFYDEKYWKKPRGIHGNIVRSKMLKRGWVYLHRMWWDNSLQSYRDDIIFVKQSDLTKQNPKHLSKWGERALPDPSTGEWLIFNSKIIPPEYENEEGFTASSAYLCMMDTSGEKAVKEATIDLKSGNHMDKFFIILIGGAFVIIFAFFLMGGFK